MWENILFLKRTFVPARLQAGTSSKQNLKTTMVRFQRRGQQAVTSLSANVSARNHFTQTFPWTIDNCITPASLNVAPGSTNTAFYTTTASKGTGAEAAFIDGRVCVTNDGAAATENLSIVINLTMPPSTTVIASAPVDTGERPILAPGETICYNYRIDVPNESIIPEGIYKITADITIANHSGHLGAPFGHGSSDTTTLPASPMLVNDTIHVDDTNGKSFTFSSSGSQTYDRTFTCKNTGTNITTATILETGQRSSAGVIVTCEYLLNETVCVQADITVTPNVEVGNVKYFCVDSPITGACEGTPVEECTFMVSQNICIQVPLTFAVDTVAAQAGIVCGTPAVERCEI